MIKVYGSSLYLSSVSKKIFLDQAPRLHSPAKRKKRRKTAFGETVRKVALYISRWDNLWYNKRVKVND
jgi:hypothetical protein